MLFPLSEQLATVGNNTQNAYTQVELATNFKFFNNGLIYVFIKILITTPDYLVVKLDPLLFGLPEQATNSLGLC